MTYLSEFAAYLKSRTDAPDVFHTHAALCTLAVAMGVRCWVDGPAREVFPNLNCVILAPSGMGKSVPLDMAANLVRKAGMGDTLLPASFSQEALLERLSQCNVGLFVVQEFAAFQALLSRDYNSGAEQTLTELYDVPEIFERRLRKNDGFTLKHPCVTILGASSPDWFAQAFKGNSLRGGWLARFLFAPSRAAGEPIGNPGPRDVGLEAGLAGHLRQVMELHGRFDTRAVASQYDAFARKCRLAARESAEFGGMRSRGPVMAQKVAMLVHVSRDPTTTALDEDDMARAITFIENTHKAAEYYLTNEVAHDVKDAQRLRIVEIVRSKGGRVQWSVVLKNSHMDKLEFQRAIDTMIDNGTLVLETEGRVRFVVSIRQFAANRSESANWANGHSAVPVGTTRVEVANSANSGETDSPF
jgi:hypothetical protein